MPRRIKPLRVESWPARFWARANDSYAGNDLVCRGCGGSGLVNSEEVCVTCRGSGLLVPRRRTPTNLDELRAAAEFDIAWAGLDARDIRWPLDWCWVIDRVRFPIRRNVYLAGPGLAYMDGGSVVATVFRRTAALRHLNAVFRYACGENATQPVFALPW